MFRRIASRIASGRLTVYVVPGLEVARAHGFDLPAAGLQPVLTPRHAAILVLIGPIPRGLAMAAATVYAQMPRPRLILAIGGAPQVGPLPPADLRAEVDQAELGGTVALLRQMLAARAWAHEPQRFTPPGAEPEETGDEPDGMQMGMEGDQGQGGGGMSMAMMTMDLPRGADGLAMEWLELPFGPLFPGLPGGLHLKLTLDGDTVAEAKHEPGAVSRGLTATWPGSVDSFVARFTQVDPLAPMSYGVLAQIALEQAAGGHPSEMVQRQRVGTVERERSASHLSWLASFGLLLGDRWLSSRAATLEQAIRQARDVAALRALQPEMERFARHVRRLPLLERRLRHLGRLDERLAPQLRGPLARAAGLPIDVRSEDSTYRDLGFAPIVREENTALGRLHLRLTEIEQSLQLVMAAGAVARDNRGLPASGQGTGVATIETPRGAATLAVVLSDGAVASARLDAPSKSHASLIKPVAEGHELSDALLSIASLDLSPWEMDQ